MKPEVKMEQEERKVLQEVERRGKGFFACVTRQKKHNTRGKGKEEEKKEGERRNGVKDEEGVDVGDGNTFTLIQDNYGIFLKDMEG